MTLILAKKLLFVGFLLFFGIILGFAFSAQAGFFTTFTASAQEVESEGEITFTWTSIPSAA